MSTYVILLRGVNVGGKNKVPMARFKECLEELGFADVVTYIASGNAIVKSDKRPAEVQQQIEAALIKNFKLDSELIKVLVLTHKQLQDVVETRPKGFGDKPDMYYCDAIFLMGIDVAEAMAVFSPREGIDKIWPGAGVIYSQRLGAERVKSRLGRIIGTVPYKSMTIRSWSTVTKLLQLLEQNASHKK